MIILVKIRIVIILVEKIIIILVKKNSDYLIKKRIVIILEKNNSDNFGRHLLYLIVCIGRFFFLDHVGFRSHFN